jgi:TonB-dependent receptor
VHLKYKVNDWSDIRVAYTTGIARPDYLSIIPKIFILPNSTYEVGNPKLKPTTVKNIDIVASIYNNEIGLLSVNGFYKELKDVMYTTDIYNGNLANFTNDVNVPDSAFLRDRFNYITRFQDVINTSLNNPNLGFIRGMEIEWQTNFWYLPQPLNSLVLNINYTKSWSNIDYNIIRNIPVQVLQPNGRYKTVYTSIDTVFSDRLIQHASDVVNAAIGIDYKGFSGRLSFNMRGNVLNSVNTRPEETSYTGNIYRWDFTLKQALPLDGLSIAFNGVNIFHNPIKSYRKYRLNETAPITENLVTVLYPPTIYQFYLMYSF